MAKKLPISVLIDYLRWGIAQKCVYIMNSYGQDPKKWSKTSWWFTQYDNPSQKAKALYWRERAPAVLDCNRIVEGCYQQATGVNINAKARNNYSSWCSPKGEGRIPVNRRVPGAPVFIHNGSYVSHVGYLLEPVVAGHPEDDWLVVEARGVMHGWVIIKLYARGWNRWGLMSEYFNYSDVGETEPTKYVFGHRTLKYGANGVDVKGLQEALIALGYSCGKWGADGDFGSATRCAVREARADQPRRLLFCDASGTDGQICLVPVN